MNRSWVDDKRMRNGYKPMTDMRLDQKVLSLKVRILKIWSLSLWSILFSGSVDYPDVVSIWNTDPDANVLSVHKTCLGQYSKMPGKYSRGKPVYRNNDRGNRFFFIMVFHLLSATLRWKANSIHVFSGFSSRACTASGTAAIRTDQELADTLLLPGPMELGRYGVSDWVKLDQ